MYYAIFLLYYNIIIADGKNDFNDYSMHSRWSCSHVVLLWSLIVHNVPGTVEALYLLGCISVVIMSSLVIAFISTLLPQLNFEREQRAGI